MAEPLTTFDRLIITLIFDTQPKRRAAFLKKKGWELDPNDDNKYRPINSDEEFTRKIDPGGFFDLKQYLKTGKLTENVSEAGLDALEGFVDLVTGAAQEAGGVATGLGTAVVATPPTLGAGTIPGFLVGRAGGRMATYYAIEGGKEVIGDYILGKDNVDPDQTIKLIQAGATSIMPEIASKGAKEGVKLASKAFGNISNGIRNWMGVSGGKISDAAWKLLGKNPEALSDTKITGKASSLITDQIEKLFGIAPGEKIPRKILEGSKFQERLNVLESERKKIVNQLTNNPDASFELKEVLIPFERMRDALDNLEFHGPETKKAIAQVEDFISQLKSKYGRVVKSVESKVIGPDGKPVVTEIVREPSKVPFANVDDGVKQLQKIANYNWEDEALNDVVSKIVDGSGGLNDVLKAKASKFGTNYAGIKQAEKDVFDAAKFASKNITREKALSTVFGSSKEGIQTGKVIKTEGIEESIDRLSNAGVVDKSWSEGLRNNQLQTEIFNAMDAASRASGSSGINKAMATGGGIGGTLGTLVGGAPGGVIGTGIGVYTGAKMSQPTTAIPAAMRTAETAKWLENLSNKQASYTTRSALTTLSQEPSRKVTEDTEKKEELDLSDLDDEKEEVDLSDL